MIRAFFCSLIVGATLSAQEPGIGEQLRDAFTRGELTVSGFAYETDDPQDDQRTPLEVLIRQDPELEYGGHWSLRAELEYRVDNRHFTAGVNDDLVEESQRRYHLNARELYLRFSTASLDVTVGKQIFAWGKADGFNPTDNLNPYDFLDVPTAEKIGIPAVALAHAGIQSGFDLVLVPRFTPARIPGRDNRWFALPELPVTQPLQPAPRILPDSDEVQVAARFWTTRSGWDLAVSIFRGFDPIPALALTPTIPTLVVTPVTNEITEYGLSLARVVGATAFHFEGSYRETEDDWDDAFLSYVVGLNRSFYIGGGVEELRVIAEFADEAFVDEVPDRGRLTSDLARPFEETILAEVTLVIREGFEIRLASALELCADATLIQPRLAYDFSDTWQLETGFDLIDGDPGSFWGTWRDNDRFFVHLETFF